MTNRNSATGLAIALLVAVLACPLSWIGAAHADEACKMRPGKWMATYGWDIASTVSDQQTMQMQSTGKFYGTTTMTVACDGTVEFEPAQDAAFTVTAKLTMLGQTSSAECDQPVKLHFNSVQVIAGNTQTKEFPRIEIGLEQSSTGTPSCHGDGPMDVRGMLQSAFSIGGTITPDKWIWQLTKTEADSGRPEWLSGHQPWNTTEGPIRVPMPASPGATLSKSYGVTFVPIGKAPDLQTVDAKIDDVFLADTPAVTNTYTLHVADWGGDGVKPKTVTFALDDGQGGTTVTVDGSQISGNTASADFEIGHLHARSQPYDLKVTAENSLGLSSEAHYAVKIIPVPPWASTLTNFRPTQVETLTITNSGSDASVYGYQRYEGTKSVPEKPFGGGIEIPAAVPLIHGFWGIHPTQFQITPRPSSHAGTPAHGTVIGQGGLGLGPTQFTFKVRPQSEVTTTTTESELQFTSGTVLFQTPEPFTHEFNVNPLDLVASGADALSLPKAVGDALRAAGSVAGAGVTVTAGIDKGEADLTTAPAQQAIVLKEAHVGLSASATANISVDLQVVGVGVAGQLAGHLGMKFDPSPHIENCDLTYLFLLFYRNPALFGSWSIYPSDPSPNTITQCKSSQAAALERPRIPGLMLADITSPLLALRDRLSNASLKLTPTLVADAGPPSLVFRIPQRPASVRDALVTVAKAYEAPPGRVETALVDAAPSPVAAPAVAAGPDGRMAYAWIGEDLAKPRPASWQLRLRLFDGHAWRDSAVTLGDGQRPDFMPALAFAGNGDLVAAWTESKREGLAAGQVVTDADLAGHEIATAICDGTTGAVKARAVLTNDALPDLDPQLARGKDGTIWIAWQKRSDLTLNNLEAPVSLMTSRLDGVVWSPAEIAASGLAGTRAWRLVAQDTGRALLLVDSTVGNQRSIMSFTHQSGNWAAASTDAVEAGPAGVAGSITPSGAVQRIWSAGKGIVAATGSAAPVTLIAGSGARPLAFNDAGRQWNLLVETSSGLASIGIDPQTHKAGPARALTTTLRSLGTAPSFDLTASGDWVVAHADLPLLKTDADGRPLGLTTTRLLVNTPIR
ncbi:hypothetical protein [Mesorhizobium loti]|uniref:hypothetical protein n=1 Tax=Rhizobium loti TaxID=381 RepID=UPI001267EF8C|nr:hypothetical protein [Mesorhizobium loti]